jgi:hypothetical protein
VRAAGKVTGEEYQASGPWSVHAHPVVRQPVVLFSVAAGAAPDRENSVGFCRNGRRLSPLLGILQNDTAPMIIDNPPFLDLLQGSKAAEAGKVIV